MSFQYFLIISFNKCCQFSVTTKVLLPLKILTRFIFQLGIVFLKLCHRLTTNMELFISTLVEITERVSFRTSFANGIPHSSGFQRIFSRRGLCPFVSVAPFFKKKAGLQMLPFAEPRCLGYLYLLLADLTKYWASCWFVLHLKCSSFF